MYRIVTVAAFSVELEDFRDDRLKFRPGTGIGARVLVEGVGDAEADHVSVRIESDDLCVLPQRVYMLARQIGRRRGAAWIIHADDLDQAIREGRLA